MITKYDDFWHFYFYEKCSDSPIAILATVEKMFKEIEQMADDIWYVRAAPSIERLNNFDGTRQAVIWCRFSSKPRVEREMPQFLGLGK